MKSTKTIVDQLLQKYGTSSLRKGKTDFCFKVLTGSHLYGTVTETSDYDYKVVYLPSIDDAILGKKFQTFKQKPEGISHNDKMIAGEAETEFIPLQTFLSDFFDGQTYALEIAFAVSQGLHEYDADAVTREYTSATSEWWFWRHSAQDLLAKWLTSNVKKMAGYAVSQAKLYGLKTERHAALQTAIDLISASADLTKTLQDDVGLVNKLLTIPNVTSTLVANARGGAENAAGIDVIGKKFPLTNKWATVLASLRKQADNYGTRVTSFSGEGADWKAMSHAMRIGEQLIELSEAANITFPRHNASFLRDVKRGKVPLDIATNYLENVFDRVDLAIANSRLQERTPELESKFNAWTLKLLRFLYGLN